MRPAAVIGRMGVGRMGVGGRTAIVGWAGVAGTVGVVGTVALTIRVLNARHRRILHPKGSSFTGRLEVFGQAEKRFGAELIDRTARYPVTVRVSKGGGTPGGMLDVRGLAIRVHGPAPDQRRDLLLSTAGTGQVLRHSPVPRWSFDAAYGSILAYRTGSSPPSKIYLTAVPDPDGPPLGRSLESVVAAAAGAGVRMRLRADGVSFGLLTFGETLSSSADAALAFDPVRNTTADLHPTGLVHASRAWAYRLGQRWRKATPAPADPTAVTRVATHA